MNKKELVATLKKHDILYHTIGKPEISDLEYDSLKDKLIKLDPKNPYFQRVGADIPNSIELPYYMGSLNKIRDNQKAIDNWKKKFKGPYYVSEKLDGISALYDTSHKKIYTRGNGTYGSDVTYIIPYINLPNIDSSIKFVRGELVIPKNKWNPTMGTNPRNTVAGVVNAKILKPDILSIVDFVPYTIIDPLVSIENIQSIHKSVKISNIDILSMENLQKILKEWKLSSNYDIDGIVITQKGEFPIKKNENPKHAFAFKSIDTHDVINVTVQNVEWNQSKDGLLKPRVLFNSVYIDGAYISAASGHNARFIYDNNIGIESIISIIRSGGVIPKIHHVIKHADSPIMPSTQWKWNDNNIEAVAVNINNEQHIAEILHFFKKLNIKGIGKKLVELLYNNGYTSIENILQSDFDKLSSVKGIGKKSIELLNHNISSIKNNTDVTSIMVASNIFKGGIGEKKIKLITDSVPDILTQQNISIDTITSIDGIGESTAKQFLQNLETFKIFYNKYFQTKNIQTNTNKTSIYQKHVIVFTGFRDKQIEDIIINGGGKIVSSVSKKTTLVVAKDINSNSNTLIKAREFNIPILDRQSLLHTLSIVL